MKKIATLGVATTMLFLVSINLSADSTNLLSNPGFETAASGVSPGTAVSFTGLCDAGGGTAAASWNVWSNGCGNESTTLVSSTLSGGGSFMLEVQTSGSDSGLYQQFFNTPPNSATASAWVWVQSGCVGIGAGNDGFTQIGTSTCTTGQWIQLTTPSGSSPVTEFIVYDTAASNGATFFVDNASVVTPEPASMVLLAGGLLALAGLRRRKATGFAG